MFGKAGVCVVSLIAGLASAQIAPRTNEIAPGRVNELIKMQDSKPPTVVVLPPEPTPGTSPRPYPVEVVYPYVGYGYGYGYGYYPYRHYYSQPVSVNQSQVVNVTPPTAAPLAPAKPLTELDYAVEAMRAKRTGVSIDHFIEYLRDHGEDFTALRLSALMYLEEKQPSEAATRIAMAYKRMPELARRPIDAAELGIDPTRLRELVLKASKYAQRMKTGSGWLMMSVLTQAEGRTDVALSTLKKAAAAGLDPEIVASMMATLAPGENEQVPATEPDKAKPAVDATPAIPAVPSNAGKTQ